MRLHGADVLEMFVDVRRNTVTDAVAPLGLASISADRLSLMVFSSSGKHKGGMRKKNHHVFSGLARDQCALRE